MHLPMGARNENAPLDCKKSAPLWHAHIRKYVCSSPEKKVFVVCAVDRSRTADQDQWVRFAGGCLALIHAFFRCPCRQAEIHVYAAARWSRTQSKCMQPARWQIAKKSNFRYPASVKALFLWNPVSQHFLVCVDTCTRERHCESRVTVL